MAYSGVVCSFDATESTAFVGLALFLRFFLLIIDAADRPDIALEESSFMSELAICEVDEKLSLGSVFACAI